MLLMNSAGGEEVDSTVIGIHRQNFDGVPVLHPLVCFVLEASGCRHLVFVVIPHQPEGTIIEVLVLSIVETHYNRESVKGNEI